MNHSPKKRGELGESLAHTFLARQGLMRIEKNFRCRLGEIDLILQQSKAPFSLVFVEVRLRKRMDFGSAIESVTAAKARKIRLTADYFLSGRPEFSHTPCRFDVVGIQVTEPVSPHTSTRIEHLNQHYWIDWRQNILFE